MTDPLFLPFSNPSRVIGEYTLVAAGAARLLQKK